MRKYVVGFIFGVLLTFGFSAYAADGFSKVGKTITAEYPVFLDGIELPVTAVAFEGTSYAPVRILAETLGLEVDFQENKIFLLTDETVGDEMETPTINEEISKIEGELRVLNSYLELKLRKIEPYADVEGTARMEELAKENPSKYRPLLEERKKIYDELKAEIDELQAQIAELKARKAELQAQLEETTQ